VEESPLARQVADELKGHITASVNSIRDGKYQDAYKHLSQALSLTELLEYNAGSAMVLYNLANLHAISGEKVAALETATCALKKAQISHSDIPSHQKLVQQLLLEVQKDGADCVKNKDYRGALSCFEVALTYAPEEKKALLERQIVLLRRVLNGR